MSNQRRQQITMPCLILCGLIVIILGVLLVVPEQLVTVIRPLFIGACLVFPSVGYYRLGGSKWLVFLMVLYTIIFVFHEINSDTRQTFISLELFAAFFLFAGLRIWSEKEIHLILIAVCVACTLQAVIVLVSNNGLIHASGSQHISFLNTETNRNPVAFAITPGVLSGITLFYHDKNGFGFMRKGFFGLCTIISGYAVLGLGCRSAFIAMAIGVLLFYWGYNVDGKTHAQIVRYRVALVLMIIILYFVMTRLFSGTYSERLFQLGGIGYDSGRRTIWKTIWPAIMKHPWFGQGFAFEVEGLTMGTHNAFLTTMLYSGFTGGLLLAGFFLVLISDAWKYKSLISLGFIAEAVMHSMTESGMDYYAFIPLVLASIFICYQQNTGKRVW